MALKTLGTNGTTSLNALLWPPLGAPPAGQNTPADLATLANSILDDQQNTHPIVPGAIDNQGILRIPNRAGWLKVLPGDYICIDPATGWPFLLSANAVANGPYTHT